MSETSVQPNANPKRQDESKTPGLRELFQSIFSKYKIQIAVVATTMVVFGAFILASPQVFLRPNIYIAFMTTAPFFGIMALGLTLVLVSKQIDLSFPSTMALSAFVSAVVFRATGSLALALLCGLVTGGVVGVINGLLVTKVGVPSIIVTLGMMFAVRGLAHVLSQGLSVSLTEAIGNPVREFFVGSVAGIPAQSIWFLFLGAAMWLLLFRHRFGDNVLFVGDNENAARMMGVSVDRTKIMVFVVVGLLAALAGFMDSLRLYRWFPTMGEGYLLLTFAAVFVGGTSMFGGQGTIFGTFLGTFLIGSLEAGIIAANISGFWTRLFVGLLILVAVSFHAWLSKR